MRFEVIGLLYLYNIFIKNVVTACGIDCRLHVGTYGRNTVARAFYPISTIAHYKYTMYATRLTTIECNTRLLKKHVTESRFGV